MRIPATQEVVRAVLAVPFCGAVQSAGRQYVSNNSLRVSNHQVSAQRHTCCALQGVQQVNVVLNIQQQAGTGLARCKAQPPGHYPLPHLIRNEHPLHKQLDVAAALHHVLTLKGGHAGDE